MTTQNTNKYLGQHFELIISNTDFDTVTFRSTNVSGLGWNISDIETPYNGSIAYVSSNTVRYNELTMEVILDEELTVLEEVFKHQQQLRNIASDQYGEQVYFTGILTMFDTMVIPKLKFTLGNCWISSMGDITFDSGKTDSEEVRISLTIRYETLDIKRIN